MHSYKLLSDRDKALIQQYIEAFGPVNGPVVNKQINIENILKSWSYNKYNLLKMFGGKDLILRRPFTYQMSKEGLSREFDYLCDKDCRPLQTIRNCLCVMSFDYPQYETFFNEILSKEVLIENRYLGDSFIFEFKDGEHFKISKGMKPMKIVHHLLEKYDTNFLTNINNIKDSSKYDALRIWHS